MATVTITDWTGMLAGTAGDDYRLLSSGAQFTSAHNRAAVDANTVGLWRMDGNWADAGPGGYDLTASGASFLSAGWMDESGVWDVSTDTAKYPSFLDWWYGPATCEFWAYWRGGATQYQRLFELSNSWNRQGFECESVGATSNWEFRAAPTTARRRYARFASFPLDTWTHVAVTFDGTDTNGSIRVWYNGVEQTTYAQGGANTDSSQPTWTFYAGNGFEGTRALYGELDDLRLSNVQRYTSDFVPSRFATANVRTGSGMVDAGNTSNWTQIAVTTAARSSDETYAVYVYPSASADPPGVADGGWVLAASGQTGSATIDLSGLGLSTGRYMHTKFLHTPSTDSLKAYQIAIDAATWTYTPAGGGVIYPILRSGQAVTL